MFRINFLLAFLLCAPLHADTDLPMKGPADEISVVNSNCFDPATGGIKPCPQPKPMLPLTTEWIGPIIVEAKDSTPQDQHFYSMDFEIGLRSDGVVVWRKKK